jgi:hypothetical protein
VLPAYANLQKLPQIPKISSDIDRGTAITLVDRGLERNDDLTRTMASNAFANTRE